MQFASEANIKYKHYNTDSKRTIFDLSSINIFNIARYLFHHGRQTAPCSPSSSRGRVGDGEQSNPESILPLEAEGDVELFTVDRSLCARFSRGDELNIEFVGDN